jgi:hypothetical protein
VFLALIAIPVLVILTVHFHAWSEDGVGHALYVIHDSVFLPLKGQIHTRNLPLIFVIWGIVITFTGLILLSRFTDRSFIKGPHVALLRFMIRERTRTGRWLLLRSSKLFSYARQRPTLILTIAEQMWEYEIIHLSAQVSKPESEREPKAVRKTHYSLVMRLLEFIVELRRYDARAYNAVMLIEQWHFFLLLSYVYLPQDARSHLLPRAEPLLDRILRDWRLPAESTDLNPMDNLFHPRSLLQDVRDVFTLSKIDKRVAGPDAALDPAVETPEIRLHRSWAARRKFLEDCVARLQAQLSPSVVSRVQLPPALNVPEDLLPFAARLSLNLALHFALIESGESEPHIPLNEPRRFERDTSSIWNSYQAAIESLHLLANVVPPEAPTKNRGLRNIAVRFGEARRDTPTPLDRAVWLLGSFRDNLDRDPANPTALDTFLAIETHTTAALSLRMQYKAQEGARNLWHNQPRAVIEHSDFAFEKWEAELFEDVNARLTTADLPMQLSEESDDDEITLAE